MDEKRRSSKRKSMGGEEGYWDCSVCTYRNSPEAFKCEMCDVRKGTSTRSGRKPRINPAVVMQQVAQQSYTPLGKKEKKDLPKKERKDGDPNKEPSTSKTGSNKKNRFTFCEDDDDVSAGCRPPRLKNIDRSSGQSMEVTVGNVTVVITDYQPKKQSSSSNCNTPSAPGDALKHSPGSSSTSSLSPNQALPGAATRDFAAAAAQTVKTEGGGDGQKGKADSLTNGEVAATRDES